MAITSEKTVYIGESNVGALTLPRLQLPVQ